MSIVVIVVIVMYLSVNFIATAMKIMTLDVMIVVLVGGCGCA